MKVLLINGSPHKNGCTFTALNEVAGSLNKNGIESEIIHIGTKAIQGCIACGRCRETGKCAFRDEVYNELFEKIQEADGVVVGSPVYYAGPNGSLCAMLDRLFYSGSRYMTNKPAAAVVSCRRGGASATFDRLNKYFTINQMPVVSSQYWNSVHGNTPDEVKQDLEGLQVMRTLGNNMAWMIKTMKDAKYTLPEREKRVSTNFIR
ncbi:MULTISPECIES: flavodoxin family protein [Clostridium]|uniref:Multimeric flavodoxin WrbA n=1 Tax=Clostridium cadaveris TaxID=1529 RepID=A0A1I2PUK1_9CLOT|nr:flavodoxin family protein [Clostridium cadaveris]MDM8313330.1 flavodoxin family protein [Clostridium cadaveris]MDU4951832.1 flavodoxin family protein [Clostridium sp.]NME64843.1 flavodoxin family protein [Clostridium cadaveris]SFG19728.1 Multimeric flavodoxin WrbA [Clostridium cadaveris]